VNRWRRQAGEWRSVELFLLGLLSVADALLDKPHGARAGRFAAIERYSGGIAGGENEFRGVLDLMLAYEGGTWNTVAKAARRVNVEEARLPDCYMRASEKASILV